MLITMPLQLADENGLPTGRWRMVQASDENDFRFVLCDCENGHESPEAAKDCQKIESVFRRRKPGSALVTSDSGGLILIDPECLDLAWLESARRDRFRTHPGHEGLVQIFPGPGSEAALVCGVGVAEFDISVAKNQRGQIDTITLKRREQ